MRDAAARQLALIAEAYQRLKQDKAELFRLRDDQRFSEYDVPLGEIQRIRRIGLGDQEPLMKQIYDESKRYVEEILGPTAPAAPAREVGR